MEKRGSCGRRNDGEVVVYEDGTAGRHVEACYYLNETKESLFI
jgi:hypothetical protein